MNEKIFNQLVRSLRTQGLSDEQIEQVRSEVNAAGGKWQYPLPTPEPPQPA